MQPARLQTSVKICGGSAGAPSHDEGERVLPRVARRRGMVVLIINEDQRALSMLKKEMVGCS